MPTATKSATEFAIRYDSGSSGLFNVIGDQDLERFLLPPPAEWNNLAPQDLRGLRSVPLASDPTASSRAMRAPAENGSADLA
jgi:hypothetical protein